MNECITYNTYDTYEDLTKLHCCSSTKAKLASDSRTNTKIGDSCRSSCDQFYKICIDGTACRKEQGQQRHRLDVLVDIIRIKIKIFKQSVFIIVKKDFGEFKQITIIVKKRIAYNQSLSTVQPKEHAKLITCINKKTMYDLALTWSDNINENCVLMNPKLANFL